MIKFLFILLLLSNFAYSYDMNITCNANGEIEKIDKIGNEGSSTPLNTDNLFDPELANSVCKNIEDCIAHLGHIADLSHSTFDILSKFKESNPTRAFGLARLSKDKITKLNQYKKEFHQAGKDSEDLILKIAKIKNNEEDSNLKLLAIQTEYNTSKEELNKKNNLFGKMFNKKNISRIQDDLINKEKRIKELEQKITENKIKMEILNREQSILLDKKNDLSNKITLMTNDSEEINSKIENDVETMKDLLGECSDNGHQDKLQHGKEITIYYPYNGRGNNKTSTNYDKESIQDIIDMAVTQGVDPYTTLSIIMVENAPIKPSQGKWSEQNSYVSTYGAIPVDGIAAYHEMGCQFDTDAHDQHTKFVSQGRSIKKIRIGSGNTRTKFCSGEDQIVRPGSSPYLDANKNSGCCIEIIGRSTVTDIDVKTALGIEFLKGIQNRIADDTKDHQEQGAYFGLGYNTQRYNGLGTFGATEQMDNQCLIGVNMKQRPVYGLLVQDLAFNSLMLNPVIQKMIEKSKKEFKAKAKSNLCLSFGEGTHKIDTREFLNLQKDLLFNYEGKVSSKYKAIEKQRAKNCSKNGQVTYDIQ